MRKAAVNLNSNDALYVSWKLPDPAAAAVRTVRRRLSQGHLRNLYHLRSWVIMGDEVQALLSPASSLDIIATVLGELGAVPVASRWVAGGDCAGVTRDIETAPVARGLAERPEQWCYSSAAGA